MKRKGFGNMLMDFLEEKVFERDSLVKLCASLPAESMYLKRRYRIQVWDKIMTENGDYLCYHTTEKRKQDCC